MKELKSQIVFVVLIISEIIVSGSSQDKGPESDYILRYEGLVYSPEALQHRHQRVRRSVESRGHDSVLRLDFYALNRQFKLRLRRDTSTFVERPEILQPDGTALPLDISYIYQGHLEDEPDSYVHGSVIAGIFSGRIDLKDGSTYYVDKSEQHFPGVIQPFHSIVYSEQDVLDSLPAHKRTVDIHQHRLRRSSDHAEGSSCGLTDSDIHRWMEQVQKSAVDTSSDRKSWSEKAAHHWEDTFSSADYSDTRHHDFYLRYASDHQLLTGEQDRERDRRRRRETGGAISSNRLCALFLQSDPMLWDYMTRPSTSTNGEKPGLGYDANRAREEITFLFASHVDGIKKIYQNTVFEWDTLGPFRQFTFAVHRIQINTTADCDESLGGGEDKNPFCKKNIDVSNFLNLNSLTDQDMYCLAYVFTYRDFTQGTLGLAWVGSALRASGGLCERWKEYSENNKRIFKSLNTGIVTLVNYGTRVPPKVSTLTFAHEVGHNFGSPHDSGEQCVPTLVNPNDPNGNYIMFASATSGDKQNNHKFSPCSIGNMTQVLNAVLTGQYGKVNCFGKNEEAFCGNRIVEDSEQCDCGFTGDCQNSDHPDKCCHPRIENKVNDTLACTRTSGSQCSASEGPCCVGESCSYVPSDTKKMCQIDKDCSEAAYCNGSSARCPVARPKTDLSLCNANTQICRKGECTGSVCEKIGWSLCFIDAPTNDKSYDRGLLCFVSCLNNETRQCISSGSQQDLQRSDNIKLLNLLTELGLQNKGIRMPAGMPCDNYRGYCDVFQKCRAVNEDGPLARLKNLLFSEKTFGEIRDWITTYWYLVIPMALGVIILMGLFIKVCAVHTPSSNPKQTPARKLTLPRRHAHRPQGPPPPYSETGGLAGSIGFEGISGGPSSHHAGPQPRQNRSRHSQPQPGSSRRQQSPATAGGSRAGNKKNQRGSGIEMKYRANQV